jgi:FAD:protein FMN transferase
VNAQPFHRRALLTLRARAKAPAADYWIRVHRRAMACRFEVALSGEHAHHVDAARAALDEIDRIESVLTVFRETSPLVDVNRRAAREAVPVDEELFALLRSCAALHEATGGAFDITTTPLSRCWGFLRREGRLPAAAEIEQARAACGTAHLLLDERARTVRFDRAGVELNLGAIGKGYALRRVARQLRADGVTDALVSAGGSSVVAIGGPFHVTVRPRRAGTAISVWLEDAAIATSGAGEQFFEVDGRRFGHVLDPRTGWPAEGTLAAAVAAPDAEACDALSTAFLVGGAALAARHCDGRKSVLALVWPDDGSERHVSFGACAGAAWREEP